MPRLFQPFQQLDSSLSRHHEGTGLGLALVRRLAELHGGSVKVESIVGQGSCFTIALPYHPPALEAMPPDAAPPAPASAPPDDEASASARERVPDQARQSEAAA